MKLRVGIHGAAPGSTSHAAQHPTTADQQSIQPGGFQKRHVSGMLKHLKDDESRAKAYAAAAKYKKMFEDKKKWDPVMEKIRQVVNEDHMMVVESPSPAPITPATRPSITTSTSAPPVVLANGKTPPVGLTRIATSTELHSASRMRAPSTPRERWDATYRGPSTPLSPTPTGNAFGGGGFWEQQLTPGPVTPVTAVPRSPLSPVVPRDSEARAAYNYVKAEVDALARSICASRLSVHSKIAKSDDVPDSLVKPKDVLKAASITLRCLQTPVKSVVDPDLLKKLEGLAEEEAKIVQQYSVRHNLELLDIDNWLQVDEDSLAFNNLLDAQRELLLMHRNRRKSQLLKIPDAAIQQAWAVRILEDAERAVEADADGSSASSNEDKGYDYNNFLRSIKQEVSSSSDLASMVGSGSYTDLASMRSSGTNSDGLVLSRETTMESQRSSTSPKKSSGLFLRSKEQSFERVYPEARQAVMTSHYSGLVARSREPSFSTGNREVTVATQRSSTSPKKPSLAASTPTEAGTYNGPSLEKRASAIASSRGLTLLTTNITEGNEDVPTPALSPEDKAFRRQGASHLDLNHWAQQLKQMEESANKNRAASAHNQHHPAYRHHSKCSSGCLDSWQLEKAVSPAREASAQKANSDTFATNREREVSMTSRPPSSSSLGKETVHPLHRGNHMSSSPPILGSPRASQSSLLPPTPIRPDMSSGPPAFTIPPPPKGFKYAQIPSFASSNVTMMPPGFKKAATASSASVNDNISPPPGFKYAATLSTAALHDTVRRQQHVRSKSSIARVEKKEKGEEEEWVKELKMMEEKETVRQREESARMRSGSLTSARSGEEPGA
ncbi:hypothetical protein FB567DRAFT_353965 [Paraphoma chrysanthemicola]|uniref:Uncharacterized protein n=1 Tax=Paraphoma chrysanthemicola TaxID=798071 RepID=A0A8K0R671_9PLEO|nr:hypothetical protein FB567DRAFT_353965 [Paraphoma chrysanthemicola]